jgi:hypothetical protein
LIGLPTDKKPNPTSNRLKKEKLLTVCGQSVLLAEFCLIPKICEQIKWFVPIAVITQE